MIDISNIGATASASAFLPPFHFTRPSHFIRSDLVRPSLSSLDTGGSTSIPCCVHTNSRGADYTALPSSRRRPVLSTISSNSVRNVSVTTAPVRPSTRRSRSRFYLPRLSSLEDRRWVHKTSCAVFVLSSAVITVTPISSPSLCNINFLWSVWLASTATQAVSGVYMALRFRRAEPRARDVFVHGGFCLAFHALVVAIHLFHIPSTIPIIPITATAAALSAVTALGGATDFCAERTPHDRSAWRTTVDKVAHTGMLITRLAFILLSLQGVGDGSMTKVACTLMNSDRLHVIMALVVGVQAFLVTVRDRKMITKDTETIATYAVLAVQCTVAVATLLRMPS